MRENTIKGLKVKNWDRTLGIEQKSYYFVRWILIFADGEGSWWIHSDDASGTGAKRKIRWEICTGKLSNKDDNSHRS